MFWKNKEFLLMVMLQKITCLKNFEQYSPIRAFDEHFQQDHEITTLCLIFSENVLRCFVGENPQQFKKNLKIKMI